MANEFTGGGCQHCGYEVPGSGLFYSVFRYQCENLNLSLSLSLSLYIYIYIYIYICTYFEIVDEDNPKRHHPKSLVSKCCNSER